MINIKIFIKLCNSDVIVAIALCLITFSVFYCSPVRSIDNYSQSDPRFTLLTAQSIVQNKTIRLDKYITPDLTEDGHYSKASLISINNHHYDYFPIGSAIMMVPVTAVTLFTGRDMTIWSNNYSLQMQTTMIILALTSILLYLFFRTKLNKLTSLLLALSLTYGTSLSSTCGTGLWNFCFEIVFILISMILLFEYYQKHSFPPFIATAIGVLLFMAYLCRPSALIIFCGTMLLFLIQKKIKASSFLLLGFIIPLLGFIIFSYSEYKTLLPPYYSANRVHLSFSTLKTIPKVLLSPSRGLFIYSPQLLATALFSLFVLKRKFLITSFALGWITIITAATASFWKWWGGWSFGPRLLTDTIPAFAILTLIIASTLTAGSKRKKAFIIAVTALSFPAIFINIFQGQYNINTSFWNSDMDIDNAPKQAESWKDTQFLYTEHKRRIKLRENFRHKYRQSHNMLYHNNLVSDETQFAQIRGEGWSHMEHDGVWSSEKMSSIYLPPCEGKEIHLALVMSAFIRNNRPTANVRIKINGKINDIVEFNTTNIIQHRNYTITNVPPTAREIELLFIHSDPIPPNKIGHGNDPRKINIKLSKFEVSAK